LVRFGVALVRIKDKPVGHHLLKFTGYRMSAMGRVYLSAQRVGIWIGQVERSEVAEPAVPKIVPQPRVKPQHVALAGGMV
jgi:hypothetical protein